MKEFFRKIVGNCISKQKTIEASYKENRRAVKTIIKIFLCVR